MKAFISIDGFDINKAAIERYYEVGCYDDDAECPASEFRFFLALEAENGQRFAHRWEFATLQQAEVFRRKVGAKIGSVDWLGKEVDGGAWLESLLAGNNAHWFEADPAYGSQAWVANDCDYLQYDEQEVAFYGVA